MSSRGMLRPQRSPETPSPRHPWQSPPPLPSLKPAPTYATPRISAPGRWKYPTRGLRYLSPLPRSLPARTLAFMQMACWRSVLRIEFINSILAQLHDLHCFAEPLYS
eukprot:1989156-Pleurochrysis_carterae.AAC.1